MTGGTGFIGSHLVHDLARAGMRVRVLTRRAPDLLPRPLRHPTVELLRGEITDREAVGRLADGAKVFYHLAGCARAWTRDPAEYEHVNVAGTGEVCSACETHAVPALVHVSTNLVECGDDKRRIVTEYQRTKLRGESVVRGYVERGHRAVVVRPSRVYGPGPLTESNAVTRIVDLYRRGLFRVRLADGGARGNYVHVDDVVEGMLRAAERGSSGMAYTLGGENASIAELLATVAVATGRHARVLALPLAVARGVATFAKMGTWFGFRPPITPEWVSLFALDWPSSSEAARRDLGYAPRSLRDGLEQTVRWLDSEEDAWHFA